ncbi:MAG TPA: hypothetical protein VMV18_00680 [bacterium]|nr:hypothetical protein [bacterium]
MGIESIRIRSQAEQGAEEVALEVALASDSSRVEISIVRDDGVDVWATVRVADLVAALQVLRASQNDEAPQPERAT